MKQALLVTVLHFALQGGGGGQAGQAGRLHYAAGLPGLRQALYREGRDRAAGARYVGAGFSGGHPGTLLGRMNLCVQT